MLWSESSTRNPTERRTAIEVTAMADGLTKPQTAWKLLEIMSAGQWTFFWDETFQSARKLKVAGRSEGKREILMGDEFSMTILLNHVAF